MTFNSPTFLPPVLAVGQGERSNGRQQLGSGLVTHRGIIDSNSFRATGNLWPQHGAGLELIYDQPSKTGYLQSYDRDASAYTDLNVTGKNVTLATNGGKVTLPAGTTQQLLGTYRQIAAWNIPATGAWYESNAQVSATTTGGLVRLEACGSLTHPAANAVIYVGFMTDGSVTADSLTVASSGTANWVSPYSIVYYFSPSAALHRFSICLYTNIAGASGFWSGAYQNLFVTEQRA